jgi:phage baseplate assembly protein W
MTAGDYPQVGRGWAFPPRWRRSADAPHAVRVEMNDGIDHLEEAMKILLRTALGSRVMRPGVGAGVDRFVFEARTADVCHRLADHVRRAIVLGEARIVVDTVTAEPAGSAEDRIDVTIEYHVDRHRRPNSLVVPFAVGGAS